MKHIFFLALISLTAFSQTATAQTMLPEEQEESVPSETFDYENTYSGDEENEVIRQEQEDTPTIDERSSAWGTAESDESWESDEYLE